MQQVAEVSREYFATRHIGRELEVLLEQQEEINGKIFGSAIPPLFYR